MGFFSKLFGGGARGSLAAMGKSYQLAARTPVTHNTHRFTFALESPDSVLGLPVGQHVEVRLPGGGGAGRPYTPTTGDETKGSFDLVVKVYEKGAVSKYLDSLKVGDMAEIAGPSGHVTYKGDGVFRLEDVFDGSAVERQCRNVVMVAGGTGIAPMYQVATHCAGIADDPLAMSLLFANLAPEDTMLREELDALQDSCPRFKVGYTVDDSSSQPDWPYNTGRVTVEMLQEALGRLPGRPETVFICGPNPFHKAVRGLLKGDGLSFSSDEIIEF